MHLVEQNNSFRPRICRSQQSIRTMISTILGAVLGYWGVGGGTTNVQRPISMGRTVKLVWIAWLGKQLVHVIIFLDIRIPLSWYWRRTAMDDDCNTDSIFWQRKKNVSGRVIMLERVSWKIKTLSLIIYSGMIAKKIHNSLNLLSYVSKL